MNKATHALIAAVILAAFAVAQDAPATPQTPVAPQAPVAPATPAAPKAPRAPRAPRAPESRRSYLGIDSREITPERAASLHLSKAQGVEISMVDQDAPAGKAGLKEHDVIVGFNGKSVVDPYDLRRLIRDTEPGNTVTLGIVRDGKPMDVKVKLEGHPVFLGDIHIPKIVIPPMPEIDVPVMMMLSRHNGMTVEPITSQLAAAFGSKDGHGVLIRSVEKNSPAEAAGFRAGDVIVRVGNDTIDSINDYNQAMRQPRSGNVNVTVIREKREQNFTLALPEKRGDNSCLDSADMQQDLADMRIDLSGIGPEVEQAIAQAQKDWQKSLDSPEFRKQMEDAQRQVRKAMQMNREEIQKQVQNARREAEKAQRDWDKQQKEWQKESQDNDEQ